LSPLLVNTRHYWDFDKKIFYESASKRTEKRVLLIREKQNERLLKISNEEEKERKIKAFRGAFSDPTNPYEDWLDQADRLIKIKLNGRTSQPYKAEDIVNEIIVKVIDDVRAWDMDRCPILINLCICRSEALLIINIQKKEN
jgi:hypothetical protein